MTLSVERFGGKSMHIAQDCSHCGANTRCRRREFSEQTWSVLLAWGEVQEDNVDQPICDECYADIRDILIDRSAEVEAAIANPESLKPRKKKKAGATAKKKTAKKSKGRRGTKVA